MRMVYSTLLSVLLPAALVFVSCSTVEHAESGLTVSVDYHDRDEPVELGSFLSDDFMLVPLGCPTPEARVGMIDRVLMAGGRLFIVDRKDNTLKVFTQDGEFIASTRRMVGHGHNEYISMTDAVADTARRVVYMFCDAPYCVITLDFDLRVLSYTKTDFYALSVAADEDFIYCLVNEPGAPWRKRVVALRKDLSGAPVTILSSDKGVRGLRTFGEPMSSAGADVYVCLPFDNRICRLGGGKIKEVYTVDFGEWGASESELAEFPEERVFSRRNGDKNWMIVNIAASDSIMMFATNTGQTFVVDKEARSCDSYRRLASDRLPFSSSQWAPVSGPFGMTAQVLPQKAVAHYIKKIGTIDKRLSETQYRLNTDSSDVGNPALVLYRLR